MRGTASAAALVLTSGLCSVAPAQVDLVVADMPAVVHWTSAGPVNGVRAYSFGLNTCNWGLQPASWNFANAAHPVFAQNLHRITEAGIEQIGLGFAFHGFVPLQQSFCTPCSPAGGSFLGVGCSSPDSASILGQQSVMGPRSGVNASNAALVFPLPPNECADSVCERVQVSEADLAQPGAVYIAETIVVHAQDAASVADDNNASYRRLQFQPNLAAAFSEPTVDGEAAVRAWREFGGPGATVDTRVKLWHVEVPGDGRFEMGARARRISGADWEYRYAIENVNSDRSGGAFVVPLPGVGASDPRFHDVDYHSGEAYDPTDWTLSVSPGEARWASPQTFAQNPDSNALRWGTLYTFGFAAPAHPIFGRATIELFKPGAPGAPGSPDGAGVTSVNVFTVIPGPPPCPGDATGDDEVTFIDLNTVLNFWGGVGAPVAGDVTADGQVTFADLNAVLAAFGAVCR